MRTLVLGTRNKKKGLELLELLGPYGFDLRTLSDFPNAVEVDETGSTFADNARLKASQQARHLKAWVLGEDSGLCVRALGDAPGVYSARYSGPHATDETNNARLLAELGDRPLDQRNAYYVCHASLAAPDGSIRAESEARCCGRIRLVAAGTGGFGYDPLFEVPEYHQTFGELGNAVKSVLSHRSRALRELVPKILAIAASGEWRSPLEHPSSRSGKTTLASVDLGIEGRP